MTECARRLSVVSALMILISFSEATSDPAHTHPMPEYVSQLYNRVREEAAHRHRSTLSAGQFRFGSNYPGNGVLPGGVDDMVMQGYQEQDTWKPFQREVSQLEQGAAAVMYTGRVSTIRAGNMAANSDYLTPTGAQSFDLFYFSLARQEPSGASGDGDGGVTDDVGDFRSAYLDFWWSDLNGTDDDSSWDGDDVTLEFELDLRRGERRLRTTVRTFPLAQLPRGGDWLSVDMTAALQVWRAFVSAASPQQPATLSANGAAARLDEFAVSMFLYRHGGADDDDDDDDDAAAGTGRGRFSPRDLQAVVMDDDDGGDRRPLLTLMETSDGNDEELELSEEGVQYLRQQEHEHRERRRRSPETEPNGPPWSSNQTWIPNRSRSCQLFQYSIPQSKFSNIIVEPSTIPLNLCYGICKVPFHAHTNASTHATLTEIWKHKQQIRERRREAKGDSVTSPADGRPQPETDCVAVGFQALTVMVREIIGQTTRFTTRILPDLSANSCGCR